MAYVLVHPVPIIFILSLVVSWECVRLGLGLSMKLHHSNRTLNSFAEEIEEKEIKEKEGEEVASSELGPKSMSCVGSPP